MDLMHDKLFMSAERYKNRIAFYSVNEEITFGQFLDRVEYLAGGLESMKLKKGDRISILSRNRMDYLSYHFATSLLGVILHVMNTRHVAREWLWAMNDAESCALVIDEAHAESIPVFRDGCSSLRFVAGIGRVEGADMATEHLVAAKKRARDLPNISCEDPLLLIYTSGTTGLPKGCLQSQRGSCIVDDLTAGEMNAHSRDVYMAIMPYFHQAGLIRSRAVMMKGGANIVPGDLRLKEIIDLMVAKKATITMLVSLEQGLALADKALNQKMDFSSLRLIISGGGLGEKRMQLLKVLCDVLKCDFMGIWGQTECTGPVTVVKGDVAFTNPDTCGKAMKGIELEIWDNNSKVGLGCIGEIMVRSDMTASYWNNPEANRELYTGDWLHTGDLGRLDEQGYLYFIDRKKDLIKTGGENVYPQEVETVLNRHPAIAEVTVIGLPDPVWGEAVTAVLVLNEGHSLTVEEMKAFCNEKIAGYKIPKKIKVVDKIPKNETGKVIKKELRDRFRNDES